MSINKRIVSRKSDWHGPILTEIKIKIETIQPLLKSEAYFITDDFTNVINKYPFHSYNFPFKDYNLIGSTLVSKLIDPNNSQIRTDLFPYNNGYQQNILPFFGFYVTLHEVKRIIDETVLNKVSYKSKYNIDEIPDISRFKRINVSEEEAFAFFRNYRSLSIIAELLPHWQFI